MDKDPTPQIFRIAVICSTEDATEWPQRTFEVAKRGQAMAVQTAFVVLGLAFAVRQTLAVEVFLNEWSVQISGGKLAADQFARENGFVNFGEIIPGSGLYHMKYPRRSKRSVSRDSTFLKRILDHREIVSAEQLVEKVRVKREEEHEVLTRSADTFKVLKTRGLTATVISSISAIVKPVKKKTKETGVQSLSFLYSMLRLREHGCV